MPHLCALNTCYYLSLIDVAGLTVNHRKMKMKSFTQRVLLY